MCGARVFVGNVYKLTGQFPDSEKYNLTSQIRRAAVSITCNLSEGTSRSSFKDQARFSEIAYGSLLEVLNLLIVAKDLNLILEENFSELRSQIETLASQISGLKKSQLQRI